MLKYIIIVNVLKFLVINYIISFNFYLLQKVIKENYYKLCNKLVVKQTL